MVLSNVNEEVVLTEDGHAAWFMILTRTNLNDFHVSL